MTAPDARPPSDETPATGWHVHPGTPNNAHRTTCTDGSPVLVVDPAEAREKIAQALWEYDTAESIRDLIDRPPAYWRIYLDRADAVLAALVGGDTRPASMFQRPGFATDDPDLAGGDT